MLSIDVSRQARKFVDGLPIKHQQQVVGAIQQLAAVPYPHDSKQLSGKYSFLRRLTVGEYRVVYRVQESMVLIDLVAKRNDDMIYRLLKDKYR